MFGTIKKVVKDKGFGFIIADDGGDEVFFHRSALSPKVYFDDLREGNEVQFERPPEREGPPGIQPAPALTSRPNPEAGAHRASANHRFISRATNGVSRERV